METAVLELERKRITLENEKKEKKAAKAMEALNVSSSSATTPKSNSDDLNLIVSSLPYHAMNKLIADIPAWVYQRRGGGGFECEQGGFGGYIDQDGSA